MFNEFTLFALLNFRAAELAKKGSAKDEGSTGENSSRTSKDATLKCSLL